MGLLENWLRKSLALWGWTAASGIFSFPLAKGASCCGNPGPSVPFPGRRGEGGEAMGGWGRLGEGSLAVTFHTSLVGGCVCVSVARLEESGTDYQDVPGLAVSV